MSATTYTPEFLAEFPKSYGRAYAPIAPKYSRCAANVSNGPLGSTQCSRPNGHGPHGAWCKQHDPVAAKAKRDARYAEFKANCDARQSQSEFQSACIVAIRQIAAGHNDPAALARQIITAYEGGK